MTDQPTTEKKPTFPPVIHTTEWIRAFGKSVPVQVMREERMFKEHPNDRNRKHIEVKVYLDGLNKHPHFYITCTYGVKRYGQIVMSGGGSDHELIGRLFPKYRKFFKWHGTEITGIPMHYIANALYRAGFHDGSHYHKDAANIEYFKSTVCWGAIEEKPFPTDGTKESVEMWLWERLPRLQVAFWNDMRELGFTIPKDIIKEQMHEAHRRWMEGGAEDGDPELFAAWQLLQEYFDNYKEQVHG